ncbi:hypothetical protein ACH5RR_036771 [Cinchona calisaya]|uniref:UDP-MurNAc-pentapeptide synthetase n=1 Tax=Cinchona calisaya TaxID=153742 RepID=A0ABD2Y8X7_9GENT
MNSSPLSDPKIITINPQRSFPISLLTPKSRKITFQPQCSTSNPPLWSVHEIAAGVNGRIIKWGPPGTISTDTRTLKPGQWFLPLVGQNFDAHNFITPELASNGCIGVIGNRICKNWDMGLVQIDENKVNALKSLGLYARKKKFSGCLIGLTGSVGKTTTRNMIALALESVGSVYQSPGNWNNSVGVGLSLIGMPWNVDFGVLELGMSEKGEILELARMCRPNVRVILNVAASHLENFRSLEEVALAKGEILEEAKAGDVCVLNADDPLVMNLPVPVGVKKVLFGWRKGSHVRLVSAQMTNGGYGVLLILESKDELVKFEIPCPGLHLAINACAAAAVASLLGVPLTLVAKSLSKFMPVHRRLELEVVENGVTIINDVYNSNPASTKAAIDLLKEIECKGKRVAILGDMLELGPSEIKLHEMMLQHCCDAHLDLLVLSGNKFLEAARNLNIAKDIQLIHYCETECLASKIMDKLDHGDVILVKGSRGMKMEKIVNVIKSFHFSNLH